MVEEEEEEELRRRGEGRCGPIGGGEVRRAREVTRAARRERGQSWGREGAMMAAAGRFLHTYGDVAWHSGRIAHDDLDTADSAERQRCAASHMPQSGAHSGQGGHGCVCVSDLARG